MFRLAHISDVHLSPLPKPNLLELCSKRITGYLNWRMKRSNAMQANHLDALISDIHEQGVDHIAVTGDMVNLALPQEFINAELWLKQLGKPENVSVILGNHDAYLPSSVKRAAKHFDSFMASDGEGSFQGFPYLRVRNGVALIGINSAEATLPFMATGYFREKQADALRKILKDTHEQGLFRIIMIHHPPVHKATHHHKRLIGIDRFQEVVGDCGAELILHGHTHLATLFHIEGANSGEKQVPVLCVPSASQGIGGHKPAGRYNLLEIDKIADQWRCQWTARGLDEGASSIVTLESKDLLTG
jgi:3',5'-cyclic AMP phosphodiesterase CpdA